MLWLLARRAIDVRKTLLLIGALSLALSIYTMQAHKGATFYLLPTRAWELMVGGLIAASPRIDLRPHLRSALAIAGILIIAACVVLYTDKTPFPGAAAIPPVLGTALVVMSGHNSTNDGYGPLRSPPLVIVGRASYSFYLWHFPALSFAAYLCAGPLPLLTGLTVCIGSLLAALLTLKLLEDPVRRSKKKRAVFLPLAAMGALGAAGAAVAISDGLPERIPPSSLAIASAQNDRWVHHEECMSVDATIVPPSKACVLGARSEPPHVLLWGDSHAMVTATSMEAAAQKQHASFLFAAAADCPPGLGFEISPQFVPSLTTTRSYRYCGQYNREMLEVALASNIRTVVLSSRWTNWRIDEPANAVEKPVDIRLEWDGRPAPRGSNHLVFERGFTELVQQLTESDKRVVVVGPLPEPQFDVPELLYVQRFGLAPKANPVSRFDYERRHARILAYFRDLRKRYPVTLIEPADVLCRGASCAIRDRYGPRYFDHNHLTVRTAKALAPLYEPIFREPGETAAAASRATAVR